ncbi:Ada [Candidatus Paracaedibacter acanthamoebae]|uniref:DNA-3-methyladenine glycosylase II n=2 Tax=Candidatus Odyssella acanthamoebae TaxID=91604 RepID=A0A077AUN0_9PROT|nr:Ada [Candidatus Paracaedibacter acanthamoebae]
MQNNPSYYNAYLSRDPRFDGIFFIGVTSTGIYCRPICPARTPKEVNCQFFDNAALAEKHGFRPCLRCRPELAPGNAPIDDAHRICHLIVDRLDEGIIDNSISLESIAAQFELSSRQIRRIFHKEAGVSPIEFLQTRRLLLAKQLLTETNLAITEIAFASGFSSLRRFNDAFVKRYRMPPSRLRKSNPEVVGPGDTSAVQLSYRPPYDWTGILKFLSLRALKGVELVTAESYVRTIQLKECRGWIHVRQSTEQDVLILEFSHSLTPVLPILLKRIGNLFDLTARPALISQHLRQDTLLQAAVDVNPGLRVPGAFCGFELAVRAILGQQVTVKAATTLAGRFVQQFGQEVVTPFQELYRLAPTPERIAIANRDDIVKLGIIPARANTILALAQAFASKTLRIEGGMQPEQVMHQLMTISGIGRWTAHYIAMRALRWADAFPKEDIAIRNNLGGITAKQAEKLSHAWRPWRSYAVFHIWGGLS